MTRINAGIPPKDLHYKHLLAELREIKRIPNALHRANLRNLPKLFCLGTGHVRFFYDKGYYTHLRYMSLRSEALRRGYNVSDYSGNWNVYKLKKYIHLYNDWIPTKESKILITERINGRIKNFKTKNKKRHEKSN